MPWDLSCPGKLSVLRAQVKECLVKRASVWSAMSGIIDPSRALNTHTITATSRRKWKYFAFRQCHGQPWIQPDLCHQRGCKLSCSGCSGGWCLGWSGYFLCVYQCDSKPYDPGKFCFKYPHDYGYRRGKWKYFAFRQCHGQPWIQPDLYHQCGCELSCSECSGEWSLGWERLPPIRLARFPMTILFSVIFAIDNQPPVADAGANQAVRVNDTVRWMAAVPAMSMGIR